MGLLPCPLGDVLKFVGEVLLGKHHSMVLEVTEAMCVTSVGISRIHIAADVWVLKVLTIHFGEVEFLCSPDKAEGAIELVIVVCSLGVYVILLHVLGDRVHGLFNQE